MQQSIFRRFLSRFRSKDTPVPYEPQPLTGEPIPLFDVDDFSNTWYINRYERGGNKFTFEYANTIRNFQFVGRDVPQTVVGNGQFLSATCLVITPEGVAYELTVSFKTGEAFDIKKFQAKLSGALRKRDPSFKAGYEIIKSSTVTSLWYLNSYTQKPKLGGS